MIYAEPGATFTAFAQTSTGLAGTLRQRLYDQAGIIAAHTTTSGIAEHPAGSGMYRVTGTLPGARGVYLLVIDDGVGHVARESIVANAPAQVTVARPVPRGR